MRSEITTAEDGSRSGVSPVIWKLKQLVLMSHST